MIQVYSNKFILAVQAWVELQLKARVTMVGFPLFLGEQFLSHGSTGCVPYVLPGVPTGSCTKCLATVTLQSPCKRLWLHTSEGRTFPPTCDVCRGLLGFFFPPPFSRACPFSRSAVSSAGKICHSRFVALPFMNTFEKARGELVP